MNVMFRRGDRRRLEVTLNLLTNLPSSLFLIQLGLLASEMTLLLLLAYIHAKSHVRPSVLAKSSFKLKQYRVTHVGGKCYLRSLKSLCIGKIYGCENFSKSYQSKCGAFRNRPSQVVKN
jgi:hypothetical protein